MVLSGSLYFWLILFIIERTSGLSYNQPKFCPYASWNPNATTFATNITVGSTPWDIFITTNNTIYVANQENNRIVVWFEGNSVPAMNISINSSNPYGVFVTTSGDIYVDTYNSTGGVSKWSLNSTIGVPIMYAPGKCWHLFVDISNILYCSMYDVHQVIAKSLNSSSNTTTIVAGTGNASSTSNMLSNPQGIFVDINFDLYVADCGNDRIQLFHSGQLTGTTVAGNKSSSVTITLLYPNAVVLDADKYLFIADSGNNRIVGSGPNGFRCLVGCSGSGSASNQLNGVAALRFDSYGNIFATDFYNSRIQKFTLMTNFCAVSYNQPKLDPNATWNKNATTFASNSTVGAYPRGLFVNKDNTVYVPNLRSGTILAWLEGSGTPTTNISDNLLNSYGVFVTTSGDIYLDHGDSNQRVDKWTSNATVSVPAMYVNSHCGSLFIDINNTLYCSIEFQHKVVARSLESDLNTSSIVAGTGFNGSTSDMLYYAEGIFVDINFTLYVADFGNHRVQRFASGQLNGTTVAGAGASGTITLTSPTGVLLDADNYLFIADWDSHRVVGSGPNGFRCIVGCSNSAGSASNQLSNPYTITFDSYGNLFVTDTGNSRIQKFLLTNNSCDQTTVPPTTTESENEQITSTDQQTSTKQQTSTEHQTPTKHQTSTEHQTLTKQMTSTAIVTTSKTSLVNQKCFSPIVTLIPSTSSLSSPLQFRRSQDFYISSNIELNCNISLSTITLWRISSCTSICSNPFHLGQSVAITLSELYIPARTLSYGIYELKLTVTMNVSSKLTTSSSAYIQITPSGIKPNLVQLGTLMITSGHEQDLTLDPGRYSVDPDENVFNSSNWKYEYYCRIYGLYMFPNLQGTLLSIENSTIDPSNPSCLSNRTDNQTAWKYNNPMKSSLTILSGSLQSNRTYQWMVYMENRRNSSIQATGYVLVQIGDSRSQLIVIGCVISTMCISNMEYQRVNPTTQVALYSLCIGNCSTIAKITWNIYQGEMNSSTNISQWILFNQTTFYQNIFFFGLNTKKLTTTNQLFLSNGQINLWRFEVVYSYLSEISISALNVVINQPPYNGSCSIDPSNGTTSTLFTISCLDWYDEDGIKDYSVYVWTTDSSKKLIIAFSTLAIFQVRLPSGNNQTLFLHLIVSIRDQLDCFIEYNISSVIVAPDFEEINDFMNQIQSSMGITDNPIVRLLASGNQNTIGQMITSLSQQFNQLNSQSLEKAVASGISAASISISPLGSQSSQRTSLPLNQSALIEFTKELNSQANIRDYLMTFTRNLAITTSNSIQLQSSVLSQLTQATNQLTRTTLMIASEKCYQLSLALYSMSMTVPYEDVKIAANDLIQCATNILSGVNGPLQERTNVLNLDLSRSMTLPADYETDMESEWSNPSLFVDGNDFSYESVAKSRNLYYQKQLANQIQSQMTKIVSLLTSALNNHLNVGQNMTMNSSYVYMSLETLSIDSLSNKQIQQVGNAQIHLPSHFNANISNNSTISLRSKVEPLASLGNSKSQLSTTNLSTSISLTILDQNGNEVPFETTVDDHPIEMIIPRDPNLIIPPMILQNVVLSSTPHYQLFNLHYINITSTLSISVHLEIHPLNENISYLFIYKFDEIPQLNSSINLIDGWTLFCSSNESIYKYYLDNQQTSGHQSMIFGLRELNATEVLNVCSNSSLNDPPITNERYNFTSNYELRVYSSGCYYLDENNQWKSDGLVVGPLTNYDQTHCYSSHLTTFTGAYRILPSPINWNYVFTHADFLRNKTIYLTVICVSMIYIILMIYARWKDKKDLEKLGVTPLPDNHQSDEYSYQILVFTGQRKEAGTKSNVHFVLYGDDDDQTDVRTFSDPRRQIFQRGGIDSFILAVPKSLGYLNCIRLWHDNSGHGSSSSWFLKYIIIRDLQTMEKFHFICQQWFGVEKDDRKIERVLPVAGELEKCQFSYLLSKQAYHSVSDGHLWFSIFSRPPSTKFTRVQRCTCCFVLLFVSMFLNIMYYDLTKESTMKNATISGSLSLDPLYLSSQQIMIGVIVELFALIPCLLLVQIFRRLRSRQNQISPLRQTLYQLKSSLAISNIDDEKTKKKENNVKCLKTFPWWFIYIAYGLCLILVGISIIFIIARGIEFGDMKTQQWLTSILSGFVFSNLLTQPIKIIYLAIFVSFFCRKSNDDKEATEHLDDHSLDLDDDEEYLHSIKNDSIFTYRPRVRANRLNESEVICARNDRLKEVHMWTLIRETGSYLCFVSFLYIITYSNMNSNSFDQVNHLQKYFHNLRQMDFDYTKISTINDYWKWLEESFVGNIRAQQWYNGEMSRHLSGYINDKSNRLIGWPIMRQLRVKSELCSVESIRRRCVNDYNMLNEEKGSYPPGWRNESIEEYSLSINQSFEYYSSDELDTYICIGEHGSYSGGGGYVYEFRGHPDDIRSNLSELHQLGWIDNQTRAIIIELSLYNPNIHLFTSLTFLIELLSTGGIYPQSRIQPFNFSDSIIVSFPMELFSSILSLVEVCIIVCSWLGVGMYVWGYREYYRIGERFCKTNGYVYINLELSRYINEMLIFVNSFCCFFGTMKLIRLCRYNYRIYLFTKTLQHAGKELISFSVMFSIVFVSFLCLFYFLFHSKLSSCSTLFEAAEMLFQMMLMQSDAHQLMDAASFLGPFCFSLFILLVVFVCLSMFLSIINQSFHQAKEMMNQMSDEHIYSFIIDRFLRWIGLRKQTKEEMYEERDALMRSEYFDPIEHFPNRIDHLLDALNRLYMSQRGERLRMQEIAE